MMGISHSHIVHLSPILIQPHHIVKDRLNFIRERYLLKHINVIYIERRMQSKIHKAQAVARSRVCPKIMKSEWELIE